MLALPWTNATGPHLVLGVADRCNIVCRACYKRKSERTMPLDEIRRDLRAALSRRRVQTVSIAGAEPTLHPELCGIVRLVREHGLRSALVTNGLLLDDAFLSRLREAGLDVVMFHVDEGQRRPDLPADPTPEEVNRLRARLTARAARHGLDTGLSVTLYRESLKGLPSLLRLILDSEAIRFLFATHEVDVDGIMRKRSAGPEGNGSGNLRVMQLLRERFGLEPFASIGGTSWISYFVPVLYGRGAPRIARLRSGAADALLIRIPRLLTGRHLFYCPPRPLAVAVQLLVNQLARGEFRGGQRWIRAALDRGGRLDAKRLVFDGGPIPGPGGNVDCFAFCPNPTVKDGKLVPVCVSDYPTA